MFSRRKGGVKRFILLLLEEGEDYVQVGAACERVICCVLAAVQLNSMHVCFLSC